MQIAVPIGPAQRQLPRHVCDRNPGHDQHQKRDFQCHAPDHAVLS